MAEKSIILTIPQLQNNRKKIRTLVRKLVKSTDWQLGIHFEAKVFKAIKAEYSQNTDLEKNTPLTTIGSIKHPGRFHRKKTSNTAHNPTLYLGSVYETVGAEAQLDELTAPTTIWPIAVKLQNCLDLRTEIQAKNNKIFLELLLKLEWKLFNDVAKIPSYSQLIGLGAFKHGYEAILVPSARTGTGFNIVVFPGNLRAGSSLILIGDDLEERNRILLKNQRIEGTKA